MKPIRFGGISVAVVAIGLTIAVLASADSSRNAFDVQGDVAEAGLVEKLKAALGDSFGGAWYDRPGTQLNIAVTSAAGGRTVDALAARAGVADDVAATPVRHSWGQLEAAQDRLGAQLDDLFARAEVSTSLEPEENAVEVELGSSVSPSRRAALEREAAGAGIPIAVVEAPYPHMRLRKTAQCRKYNIEKTFCDPTIVAGVRIQSAVNACTAGPAVVLEKRTTSAQRTKTYLLTAGHCIEDGGGIGAKWSATTKTNEKLKEIGKAVDFLSKETDVGFIEVDNPGNWVQEGNIPVVPTYAKWDPNAESAPAPVVGQLEPVKGAKTCYSGQVSGTKCGEIEKVDAQAVDEDGVVVKNLVQAKDMTATWGDSGAPFFSNEEATAGLVEGTMVGVNLFGKPYYHSLALSFSKLTTKLELLSEANDQRHPFRFRAEATPTILSGKKYGEKETLATQIGNTICKGATYLGEMVGTEVAELGLTPTYSECTTAGIPATVDVNGCQYTFEPVAKEGSNLEASVDLVCPAGKQLEVTAMSCKITVPPQNDLKTVTFTNIGSGATRELTTTLNLSNIAYEEHKAGIIPCTSTVPKTNGTYTGSILITGVTGGATHRGIWVE